MPFENDVPVGYVLERVRLGNTEDDDNWLYFLGQPYNDQPKVRVVIELAGFAGYQIYADDYGSVFADEGVGKCQMVFRCRFTAGTSYTRERIGADDLTHMELGTLLRDRHHHLYICLDPEPGNPRIAEFVVVDRDGAATRSRVQLLCYFWMQYERAGLEYICCVPYDNYLLK